MQSSNCSLLSFHRYKHKPYEYEIMMDLLGALPTRDVPVPELAYSYHNMLPSPFCLLHHNIPRICCASFPLFLSSSASSSASSLDQFQRMPRPRTLQPSFPILIADLPVRIRVRQFSARTERPQIDRRVRRSHHRDSWKSILTNSLPKHFVSLPLPCKPFLELLPSPNYLLASICVAKSPTIASFSTCSQHLSKAL